jgi:DNA mismatch endonuclease (patch repair protein)
MTDIVTPEKRSLMMAGIKGKNTKPELVMRSGLHALGFRYRLHVKNLPGKPDMVFPKHNAVLFIHGCFWHGHDCYLFKWPSSRIDFWTTKINRNKEIDQISIEKLRNAGWRVGIIWECSLKGKFRLPLASVIEECAQWLLSEHDILEIKGL